MNPTLLNPKRGISYLQISHVLNERDLTSLSSMEGSDTLRNHILERAKRIQYL
jgi:hypothetical protein